MSDKKLQDYLHREGKRGYAEGKKIKYIFRDVDSNKYYVKNVDTEVITSTKKDFFNKRIYEFNSFDELMKNHQIHKAHSIDYVDGTHFLSEQKKLSNKPFNYVIFEKIKELDLTTNSRKASKRLELILKSKNIILNTIDDDELKKLLLRYVDKKKIGKWPRNL